MQACGTHARTHPPEAELSLTLQRARASHVVEDHIDAGPPCVHDYAQGSAGPWGHGGVGEKRRGKEVASLRAGRKALQRIAKRVRPDDGGVHYRQFCRCCVI